jgi:hypothetical protein
MITPPNYPPLCQRCRQIECPAQEAHLHPEHFPEQCRFFLPIPLLENDIAYWYPAGTHIINRNEAEYYDMRRFAVGNDF